MTDRIAASVWVKKGNPTMSGTKGCVLKNQAAHRPVEELRQSTCDDNEVRRVVGTLNTRNGEGGPDVDVS